MGNFKSVFESAHAEIIIEKSRFIAYCQPIRSEDEALVFIERIKKQHWDATHNVPVYVLGEHYAIQRYSDDGEPSGTAGVPILSMIKNQGLTDLVVVVTRYFGGVKLGTGGLVRAYTQAAKAGIEAASIIENIENVMLEVKAPYTMHGKIQNYILNTEQVILHETDFSDLVKITLFTSPEFEGSVTSKLIDLTNGQAEIECIGDVRLKVSNGRILDIMI